MLTETYKTYEGATPLIGPSWFDCFDADKIGMALDKGCLLYTSIAHAVGALVIVDNVFATPVFSRAVEQGADVVVYSTTKHVDGQGRALGGVICGTRDFIRKVAEPYLKHTGAAMSPFTAWIMLNGMAKMCIRDRFR